MSDFTVKARSISDAEALRYAADLERMIGEVMNGQRKAAHLPVEYMAVLIQFVRDKASAAPAATNTAKDKP